MDVGEWQTAFIASCAARHPRAAVGDGAFSPGPAVWVGRREVAHFDADRTLDVRVTRQWIRAHRGALRTDPRVELRPSTSDWIEIDLSEDADVEWGRSIVLDAVRANQPDAPPGPTPDGAGLDRRRRFH